jgi:hypothetical protein
MKQLVDNNGEIMKKWFLSILVAISLAGCGDFEWFPDNASVNRPDSFAFINQCNVPVSAVITSNTITISGLTSQAPISISTTNNSQYSINDGGFTSVAGTISNGQTVKVRHTSADAASIATNTTIVITTLTISGVSGTFKTDINPCLSGTTFQ